MLGKLAPRKGVDAWSTRVIWGKLAPENGVDRVGEGGHMGEKTKILKNDKRVLKKQNGRLRNSLICIGMELF